MAIRLLKRHKPLQPGLTVTVISPILRISLPTWTVPSRRLPIHPVQTMPTVTSAVPWDWANGQAWR